MEVVGVAEYQQAVTHNPGKAGLDDPTVAAQPLGRLDTLAGDPY